MSVSKLDAQQYYVGVRGGWGIADARFYPHVTTPPVWGALNGAISWTYYVKGKENSFDKWLGGISVELEYMQRGFQYERYDETQIYRRSIQSVILPFMWQPHFFAFDDRLRVFLNVGVTISYNFESKVHETIVETGETTTSDYEMLLVRDYKWGYGLCGGAGVGWNWSNWEVSVEGRYYFGYSDIVKRRTIYDNSLFMRSPIDNIIVSVGFSYHWGPDLKKALSARSAKRIAKEKNRLEEKFKVENEE